MKVIVVNINTSESMTGVIAAGARRYASPGTQIEVLRPYFGPQAVDCAFESYLSAVGVMDRVLAYREPYDAVVLAGFGEHGRDGLQELEVDADPVGAVRGIVEQARIAVEQDHAEAICLGCAGMAGLEQAITAELGVPVIDGIGAAVRLAEAVVGLGLATSKVSTYAPPDPKPITGWPLSLDVR
jgi:Asp/Glu/hydantoin racemase